MKATISVDHCVSDGAEAAQFMQALAGLLENPGRMLV
jgi:pyruvate dehydrogenase E2 component (dihydrolipoamide acetyltransferase)